MVNIKLAKKIAKFKNAAGPIVNLLLALIAFILAACLYKKINAWIILILYCFYFWNMNEWFNYLIIRNIFPQGDVAHMLQFGMPHWILLIFGILSGILLLYLLFKKMNNWLFSAFKLRPMAQKRLTKL